MIDIADTKRRMPLRAIMERDGMTFRNAGSSLIAICPFHEEGTPSLHLHETMDGGWFKCFGCDAKGDALSYLKQRHNMDVKAALEYMGGRSTSMPINVPVARPVVEQVVIDPLADLTEWEGACDLMGNEQSHGWAEWRGLRTEVMQWAARTRLCGTVLYQGDWRESFAIRRDDGAMLGEHIRLAPNSRGNISPKASWRYRPAGIGAWPFAVLPEPGISSVKYIFVTEGQWDALALVDVMGWEQAWPDSIALFGMRGATSWKKLMEYKFHPNSVFFLIADHDRAGEGWHSAEGSISCKLEDMGFRVIGFWPYEGIKDLNDAVKHLDENGKKHFRDVLRSKIGSKKKEPRPTFRQWLEAQKNREGAIGATAREIKRGMKLPPARAPFWKWQTLAREVDWDLGVFGAAWEEYKKL